MKIKDNKIGQGYPVYIIAELSANHCQDYQKALEMIHKAHQCGVNAIKLQTYLPETITLESDKEEFKLKGGLWDGYTLFELYKKGYTPWEWHQPLMEEANKLGLDLFSSPFDITAVDYLEKINFPAYKIASCEITDHILIRKIAETKKPVIISSGMASKEELKEAINLLIKYGTPKDQICLLKCTSAYPAKLEDANLNTLKDMKESFGVEVGLSDHTLGYTVPLASVALGGVIIEKHFTLDRNGGGLDDPFSLEPEEFKKMVEEVRKIEKVFGNVQYGTESEKDVKKLRRSLYITENLKKGDKLTENNLKSIRPGLGIHTKHYWDLLGKKVNCDIERATPMRFEFLDVGGNLDSQ